MDTSHTWTKYHIGVEYNRYVKVAYPVFVLYVSNNCMPGENI